MCSPALCSSATRSPCLVVDSTSKKLLLDTQQSSFAPATSNLGAFQALNSLGCRVTISAISFDQAP